MKGFEIINGKLPILLSAPHVLNHYRSTLTMSYKQAEPYTDEIVKEVARRLNCYAIFATEELDYDPNSSKIENNPYKREVGRIMKEKKIKIILDIHGLSDKHNFDLAIFYATRYRNAKKLAYKIANGLNKEELREILIQMRNFKDNNNETICEFVNKNYKAIALQLEIARYIREDISLKTKLIHLLSEILSVN